ncbi:MAG: cyclodeaminase/cyclohydrolase family protein [Candidatus Omnitrophica bacterium]|nr:cyclodeaminase/cyclohydrolase family protein [Candidatus Omnitrophota bacterium]
MYINDSLKKYLDDLSDKLPAPGGGSAAAVLACLGTSLINMVCNFTVGKEKHKSVENDVSKILEESRKLNSRFQELIDEDVAAFKSKDIQKSLSVPLEISHLASEAACLCPDLAKKGNPNLITDVACGIDCLMAAFSCARINVEINLKNILEDEKKANIIQELDKNEDMLKAIRDEVVTYVREIVRR